MIDVKTGVLFPAHHDEIDEIFEGLLLISARERPITLIMINAIIPVEIAEQVFDTMLANEGVAFEVKEDIARRWLRQAREPKPCFYRQYFELTLTGQPRIELKTRLLTDARIAFG